MSNRIDTFDRFVECTVLGDVFDDDELKPVTILSKYIVEEGTLFQRANGAAYGVPCLQVLLHDPSGEITICACDEDLGRRRDGDHE